MGYFPTDKSIYVINSSINKKMLNIKTCIKTSKIYSI